MPGYLVPVVLYQLYCHYIIVYTMPLYYSLYHATISHTAPIWGYITLLQYNAASIYPPWLPGCGPWQRRQRGPPSFLPTSQPVDWRLAGPTQPGQPETRLTSQLLAGSNCDGSSSCAFRSAWQSNYSNTNPLACKRNP